MICLLYHSFFCGSVVQKWLSWMVQAQGLFWGCWSRLQLSISLTGAGGSASTGWLIFGFNHSVCIPLSGANWLSSWRGRVICYHFHHILFIQNELLKKKKEKKWVANSCSLSRREELNSISWKEECYRTCEQPVTQGISILGADVFYLHAKWMWALEFSVPFL